MSYTTRISTSGRNTALAAVAGLHAIAIYALITGLGIDYIKTQVLNLPTHNIPAPTPEPQPAPPPEPSSDRADVITPADPIFDMAGPTTFRLPPLEPPQIPDFVPPTLPDGGPTATPGPRFDPVSARPKGNPGQWVTANDYPTRDIRQGNGGTALFRLSVDANGTVTGCEITRSTGHPGLDAATCDKLSRKARFDPARDAAGNRVAGSFDGSIKWVIPQ